MEPIANFGLGQNAKADKIIVSWPDGKVSEVQSVKSNQIVSIDHKEANVVQQKTTAPNKLVVDQTQSLFKQIPKHKENAHNDFARQILLPHSLSKLGPFISVADANGDGLEDFYIGGARKQPGQLYVQNSDKTFMALQSRVFETDKAYEDMGSHFFDADGDGDNDLYVASGGTEKTQGDVFYNDRLYLNDGKGQFRKSDKFKFKNVHSGSCVASCDYDKDGDLDVFVGGRVIPDFYPLTPRSYLLSNNNGSFNDVSSAWGKDWFSMGMVTDAVWADINNDGWDDLFVVGEWMGLTIYINNEGKLTNQTSNFITQKTSGWWNTITKADLDGDGDTDFVIGNLGENYKFHASQERPFTVFANDFDRNGSCDVILSKYSEGKQVPIRGRQCMSEQMPNIATTFPDFNTFANADIDEILKEGKSKSLKLEAVNFSSIILWNDPNGFRIQKLAKEAQISPVNGIVVEDLNRDGKLDLIVAGNLYGSEIETTRADAGLGLVLLNDGNNFKPVEPSESGLYLPYDVKDLAAIKIGNSTSFLVGCNNDEIRLISPKQ